MTAPEVEWVLDRLGAVVDDVADEYTLSDEQDNDPVRVRRMDRDNSRIYDGDDPIDMSTPLHKRKGKLERGCYVGVQSVDVSQSPIGTEYDLDIERVVGLRLEGLVESKYGHVDPDGEDGIPWRNGEDGLVDRVREALYDERTWPDAGGSGVSFTHLILTNEADTSSNWKDSYRWDADCILSGFESLG